MTAVVPLCLQCQRFRGIAEGKGYICEAFGDKPIPPDILANARDHRFAYPGDHGMRFDPASEEQVKAQRLDLVSLSLGQRQYPG